VTKTQIKAQTVPTNRSERPRKGSLANWGGERWGKNERTAGGGKVKKSSKIVPLDQEIAPKKARFRSKNGGDRKKQRVKVTSKEEVSAGNVQQGKN